MSAVAGQSGELLLQATGARALDLAVPQVFCETGARRTNLVFISLDTTRPDRLGLCGHTADTTPQLSRLAERAAVFDQALSVSSYTLPTHATLFSGLHPLGHGLVHPGHALDTDRVPLLAALLRQQGWATRAFTGGGFLSADYGFAHGFEALLRFVEEHRELPFFLLLQTFAIHDYRPDAGFQPQLDDPISSQGLTSLRSHALQRQQPYSEDERQELAALYDGAIASVDARLGQLSQHLVSLRLLEHTLIIVTSDHGETLGEHGFRGTPLVGHQFGLWDEQVAVPVPSAAGLFHRSVDPQELHDLFEQRPQEAAAMLELLRLQVQQMSASAAAPVDASLSEQTRQALIELGYVER